ncbi:MAG: 3-dehydroquinate synthase [Balneolales bacterium]
MSTNLNVQISTEQAYPVFVDHDLTEIIRDCFNQSTTGTDRAIAVIDANVDMLHRQAYQELFQSIFNRVDWFVMPTGETEKNVENWKDVLDFALENEIRRNTPLLAIGGGVTGDLAGYAASAIMRGLPLYHFPTTLLAMVDSSIGGKTGINHHTGKNLIGAFYQPQAVFIETSRLSTLPEKEWLCGLGEVLKYATIAQPSLFDSVTELVSAEKWHTSGNLTKLIRDCIGIKVDIVQKDEKESGIRAFLNMGHTFAHALEAFTEYKAFSHGEAVFIGLVAATHLSRVSNGEVDEEKLLDFKQAYGLQTKKYIPLIDRIVTFMYKDKKMHNSNIRLVLLKAWGEPFLVESCTLNQIKSSWTYALENVNI